MSSSRIVNILVISVIFLWLPPSVEISCNSRQTHSLKEAGADDLKSSQRSSDECSVFSSSPVEGLRIEMASQPCVFTLDQARQGISFRYDVVVEKEISGFLTGPQDDGCCLQPGPSTLYAFPQITGAGHRYSMDDVGNCDCVLRGRVNRVRLKKGRYPESFVWNGVNWSGPSDTNRPRGVPFPPGTYKFEVRIRRFRDKQPAAYVIGGMLVKIVEN